jgi:hypothetical protein
MGEQSAWTIIAKDPVHVSWNSHGGYDDEPNEYYTYDSQVGNHKNVQVGDLVFVKGSEFLIGFGQIESIYSEPGKKELLRCPKCANSPEARQQKTPKWRCRSKTCNYEFGDDDVLTEVIEVIKYRASYRNTWQDANYPLARKEAFTFQSNSDTQSAIRPLDADRVPELILRLAGSSISPISELSRLPNLIIGGHKIQVSRRRIGQQEFRLSLINRNGENCIISGAQPACVLEASHIRSFAEHESHSLDGGLLLRRDFHTLFDRRLIRINPENWEVETAPEIRQYATYGEIHRTKLEIPNAVKPNKEWLNDHYVSAAPVFVA